MSRPEQQPEPTPEPETLLKEQPGDRPIDPMLRYLGLPPPEDTDIFLDFVAQLIKKRWRARYLDAKTRLSDPEGVAFTYHKNSRREIINEPSRPQSEID